MPLPPALAARLAKRGIIKTSSDGDEVDTESKVQEEIIAEDYDDTPHIPEAPEIAKGEQFEKYQGWFACPNKWNVYHECTLACCKQWLEPEEVNRKYNKCRIKMLQRYPLPEHWQEILESGIGRYYYWNTETDLVSWLPPGHPRCQVSRSAAELRKHMMIERIERVKEEMLKKDDGKGSEYESSDDENYDKKNTRNESSASSEDSADEETMDLKENRHRDRRERERRERVTRGRGREKPSKRRKTGDILDPMDPAAYSECPRGNWASGLPQRNEARTGVDSTASGPLFQMRPYPNPGAVLRANAQSGGIGPKKMS